MMEENWVYQCNKTKSGRIKYTTYILTLMWVLIKQVKIFSQQGSSGSESQQVKCITVQVIVCMAIEFYFKKLAFQGIGGSFNMKPAFAFIIYLGQYAWLYIELNEKKEKHATWKKNIFSHNLGMDSPFNAFFIMKCINHSNHQPAFIYLK